VSVKNQSVELYSLLQSGSPVVKNILDIIPCAIALRSPDLLFCIVNYPTIRLTGFSDGDFQADPSLWIRRIVPRDQPLFFTAWKKLQEGEEMVSCDYRFRPKDNDREIWLRDVSVSHKDSQGKIKSIVSHYADISDLKKGNRSKAVRWERQENVVGVINALVHEIQNNLQTISMGLDLLRLDCQPALENQTIVEGIEQTNRSIQELREYLLPPVAQFSEESPEIVLEEMVRRIEGELLQQGIRLRMIRQSSLPQVRLDVKQFRSALERIIEFSRALLREGGELEVKAGLQVIDGQRYVELQVISSANTSLTVEEKDVFRPFLRVNDHHIGLSLALARQILHRHQGEIFFRKKNSQRGLFTILLKICSG
jgi:nitrogen-specific signal transduction histidine kinase